MLPKSYFPNAQKLVELMHTNLGYNEEGKREFRRLATAVVSALAKELSLEPEEYDLRWNAGGIAVSGEVTLHHDKLYLQFSQSGMGYDFGFMYRQCEGRRDFTGRLNHWAKWDELVYPEALLAKLQTLVQQPLEARFPTLNYV